MNRQPDEKDISRLIAERQWNLPDKGELESRREATYIDDIIQKSHLERALMERLDGVRTVFDGGAGCGRFSILLARQGCQVTHFDISQPMIDKARELAAEAGVPDRITFVKGALEDLTAFASRSFDLVISFDAPVSYTWPNQEKVIGELVRLARKRIMLSVSSRLGSLPYLANPAQKCQFILDEQADDPFVRWMTAHREELVQGFRFDRTQADRVLEEGLMGGEEEIAAYRRGEAPWCLTYTFLPEELQQLLEGYGVKNIRLAGPGAYARTLPREILVKLMADPSQKADFLDFCYRFDSNPAVCGLGKDNLLATGDVG
ncbi:MAG: class I SAM-dependent methyltransferase [Clostridia bacterium]|nr:class I SAM-dependent methyltransferase [Clostridia bacterium]